MVHKRSAGEQGQRAPGLTEEQIAVMISQVDADGDGCINFTGGYSSYFVSSCFV